MLGVLVGLLRVKSDWRTGVGLAGVWCGLDGSAAGDEGGERVCDDAVRWRVDLRDDED